MPTPKFEFQRYMAAWNTSNLEGILEFYAEDTEVWGNSAQPHQGKAALRESVKKFLATFSDINGDTEKMFQKDNEIAALIHVTSRHTGPMVVGGKTIPPTQKRLDDRIAIFLTLDARGKIKKEIDVSDQNRVMEQIGVAPAR